MGKAFTVSTLCVYGGSPYGPQEGALRRGVDVLVGTPGRVKDLMEKGTLKLDKLMCAPRSVSSPLALSCTHVSALRHSAAPSLGYIDDQCKLT